VWAAGPLGDRIRNLQFIVAHGLHIYGVHSFAVDERLFMFRRRFYRNMRAVDGANDVREPRHWMELQFVVDQWLLVSGKLDVVGSNFGQWIGDSFHGETDRRLRQTTAATNHPLEAARREELEGGEQLRIGRNGVMSACRSLKVVAHKFQQFHHGRARKTHALKELVFRHIVHSQKTIT